MLISDDRANRLWHAIISEALCVSGYHITALNWQVDQTLLARIISLDKYSGPFLVPQVQMQHRGHKTSLANILWSVQSLSLPETRISMHSVPGGDPHWGSCILIYHDQLGAAQTWDGSMSQELTFVSVYWPRFIDFVVTLWLDFNFQRWNLTKYRRNLVSQGSETEIGEFTPEQNIADL